MGTPLPVGRTAEQLDVAHRCCDQSEQHADQRRLACAVGAEQADDLAGPDAHRDVVDRDEAPERATDLIGADKYGVVPSVFSRAVGACEASSEWWFFSSDKVRITTSSEVRDDRHGVESTRTGGRPAFSWKNPAFRHAGPRTTHAGRRYARQRRRTSRARPAAPCRRLGAQTPSRTSRPVARSASSRYVGDITIAARQPRNRTPVATGRPGFHRADAGKGACQHQQQQGCAASLRAEAELSARCHRLRLRGQPADNGVQQRGARSSSSRRETRGFAGQAVDAADEVHVLRDRRADGQLPAVAGR